MPSFTTVISFVFTAYIAHSIYGIASMFIAPHCAEEPCLHPFTQENKGQVLVLYSKYQRPSSLSDLELIDNWEDFNFSESHEKYVNFSVPRQLKRNGTMYLHVFFSPKNQKFSNWRDFLQQEYLSHTVAPLTVYQVPDADTFSLLGEKNVSTEEKPRNVVFEKKPLPVTHLRSKIQLNILQHSYPLPRKDIPHEIAPLLTVTRDNRFVPPVYIDSLSFRIKDLLKVDKNTHEVNLHFSYSPISFGKLRVWVQFSSSLEQMKNFGFTDKDLDDVKGIFTDTNIYFLCLTFFVAGFHILFDILAFKNDISFWRHKKSMVGLSTRTVVWRAFSQTVIFLYLLEEDTSLLVTVPSGLGCIIEFWKVMKAFKIELRFSGCILPRITVGSFTKEEKESDQYDADFLTKLSVVLCPLVIGGAIYSLVYMPHKSWYSWTLESLVNGVYAFGFLFMLPQLFVNYKLKSVAHLPWKAFMYKLKPYLLCERDSDGNNRKRFSNEKIKYDASLSY
ncbi:hypothetical protein QYM36_013984 [Artemia franciscana]|uniref:Lipid scramblase CLPTM1L n=1 Tax=Artemia franciscana TaxID=6661 RepID=A0AA88HNR4_ARTSF|nr:hypothetical protein QYM36_013984 [Artemia franciscana]